jgi:RNA polymerase sigma-70 factor (ECF subfamily)
MTDLVLPDRSANERTVELAAAGDAAAFSRLVTEHHATMARVAYVIVGDVGVAEDAVQSAWATAWRRLSTLRDPVHVRAWLVAIAANEARQTLRRGRRARIVDLSVAGDQPAAGDPADAIGLVDLERALVRLKPDDRTLLALRFVAGFDSAEIARHVGGSASGIRSRQARLIARLRMDLDHD